MNLDLAYKEMLFISHNLLDLKELPVFWLKEQTSSGKRRRKLNSSVNHMLNCCQGA